MRPGLVPTRTQPRWVWDYGALFPGVAFVLLPQPRTRTRIPDGNEEPSPADMRITLPPFSVPPLLLPPLTGFPDTRPPHGM